MVTIVLHQNPHCWVLDFKTPDQLLAPIGSRSMTLDSQSVNKLAQVPVLKALHQSIFCTFDIAFHNYMVVLLEIGKKPLSQVHDLHSNGALSVVGCLWVPQAEGSVVRTLLGWAA